MPISVIDPAVSPDGKTLAYVDELTQGGLKRIYTVPAAGGAAVAITARAVGKETLRTPKLSNSQVVYVRFDMGKSTVERAPVDGSKKPEVLFSHGGDVRIALSSDGKLLVINARKNTLSSAATIYGQDFSTSCAAVKLIETTAGFGKIAVQ